MLWPRIDSNMDLPKPTNPHPPATSVARHLFKVLFFFALTLVSANNQAQIFMCKDASGRTVTSDRPIPECADRAGRELTREGLLKREIAAPLTPEQKRQKQILEDQQKAEQTAADEQKRQDQLLKTRYLSVSEIEAARKRSRDPLLEKMKASATTITALEKTLKSIEEEKEFYKKKTLPLSLTRKIEDVESALINEKKNVQGYATDIVNSDANYDQIIKHYREITGMPANNPTLGSGASSAASAPSH